MTDTPTPKSSIKNINPYVPGEHGGGDCIVLSANENAYGVPPRAVSAMVGAVDTLHHYCDGGAGALVAQIAQTYTLDPARIVCGNGSDELLALIVSAYTQTGDCVLYPENGFLMYAISSHAVGAVPVPVAVRADGGVCVDTLINAVDDKTKIIMLANPANPTGMMVRQNEIRRLVESVPPHVVVVLDGAYAEYVTHADYDAGEKLCDQFDNVIMTRTFSKMYGLAGIRVGWAYTSPAVADVLHRVRGPFNVNSVAQAGAVGALQDTEFVANCQHHNAKNREILRTVLRDLGISCYDSHTNFVLADFKTADRANTTYAHLEKQGILVRKMGGYGYPQCLRITIPMTDHMGQVITALKSAPTR